MAIASFYASSPAINFDVARKSQAKPILVAAACKFPPFKHKRLLWSSDHIYSCTSLSSTIHGGWLAAAAAAALGNPDRRPVPPSPADMIIDFYTAINDKDKKKVEELIYEDCCFEELTFPMPFQGRKEIMDFLGGLMDGMGKNVKFIVERVGGGYSAVGVQWHMEWKGKQIPFTRGCSFFECGIEERLVIKKGRIAVETPIKPGQFVLWLLKTITSLFDQHPNMSEKLLEKPQAIPVWILWIYKMFIRPIIWTFMFPIMAYYANLWKLLVNTFSRIFDILLKILKLFK